MLKQIEVTTRVLDYSSTRVLEYSSTRVPENRVTIEIDHVIFKHYPHHTPHFDTLQRISVERCEQSIASAYY